MTATMPEVLDEVDLDAEPGCQFVDGCDRPASLAVRAYCGCMMLLCRPCHLTLVRWLEEYERDLCGGHGAHVRCSICRLDATFWPPDVVSQVFVSVVPL